MIEAEERSRLAHPCEVLAAELGDDPAARCPLQKPWLEEERLVHVLDRLRFLAERDSERRQTHRAAAEPLDHAAQKLAVEALEPGAVDLEQRQRLLGDLRRHGAFVAHLGDVAHAAEDPVRDARRAARAAGDQLRRIVFDRREDPG
jgi:hypothetical protein